MSYVLHYAPDNASLVVRLVLEELRQPYRIALVDRSVSAQHGAAFKHLNPVGRIPALETPDGPLFETAAICLWLADRHRDVLVLSPELTDPARGAFLSWVFYLSNTVHAEMRNLFYPSQIAGPDQTQQSVLSQQVRASLAKHFDLLDTRFTPSDNALTIRELYLAVLLRWPALYPVDVDRSWFDLARWPNLHSLAERIEMRDSVQAAACAEGLGSKPFSNPQPASPPEGSAL
ncbi:glutathione S-transferase family protein [Marivita sp.]|jgi:glutathione S-transferase|uniref:glutathione S-transferase family protein n=1 Tax=Marivita sp. TaxID=2003365 RepID=UPI00321C3159